MPRLARAIAPGLAHHVTQRGNRRQKTFFGTDDYLLYLALLAEWCDRYAVEIWAYCLMPNHMHAVLVPPDASALRLAVGETNRHYSLKLNRREGWRGYLWQGRFSSFVMDWRYTLNAARYIELNPVRAGLVERAGDYPWSSARAHLLGRDDGLVRTAPLLDRVDSWATFLSHGGAASDGELFREHGFNGRPLGSDMFVKSVEHALGRILRPLPPGPPPRGIARA